jgi:chemotaxis signal transduction protein
MRELGRALKVQTAGGTLYIPSSDVVEVVPLEHIEPIPIPIAGILGVLSLRTGPLPLLDWGVFQTPAASTGLVAVLRKRLGLPLERVLEVRDLAGAPTVGLKRGDPWNPILSHRCRLSGHSHGVLEVEKLLALLHNRSFRR